ncbi:MAG: type II toxin-antitoxin system Phd/YefM family antitoxin [Acidobacteriota bacterium]|nr:type II toxin-antitoxin system Phd/YefM family antitoxin [Acidobacteriota bacterium]
MSKTISMIELRRRAGRALSRLAKSDEPITITRRGRAVAVIVLPARYTEMEGNLRRLDDLELQEMVRIASGARAAGDTISQSEVRGRLAAKIERQR